MLTDSTRRPDKMRWMSSRPRLVGWGACALLVLASSVGRAIASWGLAAPWIAPDEPTYAMLGRSLWTTGRLAILGTKGSFYGIVYPAFAGLPLRVLGSANGIRALQILQPLVMATAGFLVFTWARRLVSSRLALVGVALTLALPAFAYSGLIMTEIAFYPIATFALLVIARALEEPTLQRQALAVSTILLASLTRLQGLVLLPVLATSIGLAALFERSPRLLRRFAFALVLLSIAGGAVIGLHEAGASGDMLGAYTTTVRTSYQAGPAFRWIVWHAGEIYLLVAGLPLLAAVVLTADAVRGRERSAAARALLAVAASYVIWSVVQVGLFASRFSDALLERNLITVAPPLFIAFVLWLERGMPRPQPLTSLACVLAVAPAIALPATRLTDPRAAPQAFTSLVFTHVLDWTSLGWTRTVWITGVLALAALFLAAPSRLGWALPTVALALLIGSSAFASADVHRLAKDLRHDLSGSTDPRWIDRAADGKVTYVYDGSFYWNGVWIRAFWNSRIDRVVVLPGPIRGALPFHENVSPRFDGGLFTTTGRDITDPYVLGSERMTFVGKAVRSIIEPGDSSTLTLWKVEPPARLQTLRTGFQPNGDISGHAQIEVFACGPGELNVTFLGKDGSPVTFSAAGGESRKLAPGPRVGVHVALPAPPTANETNRCTFSLDTPGLVGTTVISFVPASS